MLSLAREVARDIAAADPNVLRVLLIGSFARGDFSFRSDLDLLVIIGPSDRPFRERVSDYLRHVRAYPTDILAYTRNEIDERLRSGDPFVTRAVCESIQLYPE